MPTPDPTLNLFIIGFDGLVLPEPVAALLARGLAGVALFARNLADRAQTAALCRAVRDAAVGLPPPVVAIDQEGGRVQRLRRLSPLMPPMRQVGSDGPGAAREAGRTLARDLRLLGINCDFAPVLDVDSNPCNPIIGDRSFSSDPAVVAACGVALAEGLEGEGVLACGKHFPGHGDASADSHLELPVIDLDATTLARREFVPFAAAVRAGLRLVMTAHCLFPALDPEHPATLSRPILQGWLRGRAGFDGCIVTDDLGMKAISERYLPDEVLVRGLDAGIDLFLHCGAAGEGMDLAGRLQRLVAAGDVAPARIAESSARVGALRDWLATRPM